MIKLFCDTRFLCSLYSFSLSLSLSKPICNVDVLTVVPTTSLAKQEIVDVLSQSFSQGSHFLYWTKQFRQEEATYRKHQQSPSYCIYLLFFSLSVFLIISFIIFIVIFIIFLLVSIIISRKHFLSPDHQRTHTISIWMMLHLIWKLTLLLIMWLWNNMSSFWF